MSPETTRVVFFAITAGMWAVWFVATRFALSRLRPGSAELTDPTGGGPSSSGLQAADVVVGGALVDGDAEAISKKLAGQLVTASGAAGSAIRITERTRERIVFERAAGSAGGATALAFDAGVVSLEAEGDGTRVRYALSLKRFARTMRIAAYAACFGYGGLIVVLVPLLIWTFVVQSDKEAVRWQVFQTLQMVHGVWPPFLIGALSGKFRKAAAGFFDTLVANAAHIA
jgi:hypothetical protein